ncbi:MAG: hypothetical protein ABJA62_08820 [Luteimonas sp.]
MSHPQTLTGKTLRCHFSDGPTAQKSFDHVFHPNGTVDWGMAGGELTTGEDAALMKAGDAVFAGSYLSHNGYTLTMVFDLDSGKLVSFASDSKSWSKQHGTFEIID